MTADRLRAIPRWACECKRCGHTWVSTGKNPPERCASCTSRYWQTGAGVLPRGRRPRAGTAVLELLIRDKARRIEGDSMPKMIGPGATDYGTRFRGCGCRKPTHRPICPESPEQKEFQAIRDKARKVRAKTRRTK